MRNFLSSLIFQREALKCVFVELLYNNLIEQPKFNTYYKEYIPKVLFYVFI
jgi:hypothetical protein